AEAGAEVEDGGILRHPALQEVGAQDPPEGVLRAPLGGAKARVVQLEGAHATAPPAAPASTSGGNAAASGAGESSRCRARGRATRSGSPSGDSRRGRPSR